MCDGDLAKRVWILGAGFSRPLGGPLLFDLFTMRQWRFVESVYGEQQDPHQQLVYLLFQWGTGMSDGTLFGYPTQGKGERIYLDAEDFLVKLEQTPERTITRYIDTALTGETNLGPEQANYPPSEFPNRTMAALHAGKEKRDKAKLIDAARTLMAMECSAFHLQMLREEGDPEPLIPYKAWAKALGHDDAIITYNYDRVAEQVVRADIPVFKMHGSIGERENDHIEIYNDLKTGKVPSIMVPGKAKGTRSDEIQTIWDDAAAHLRNAETVVFMGYGLPESDASARAYLLQHLRRNEARSLDIGLVLGEPGFRRDRLEATLRQTLSNRRVNIVPRAQYAQDYMQGFAEAKRAERFTNKRSES